MQHLYVEHQYRVECLSLVMFGEINLMFWKNWKKKKKKKKFDSSIWNGFFCIVHPIISKFSDSENKNEKKKFHIQLH
jgi:hypothetical protein